MEVMGLMLGDLVDDYTVRVVDVFAMPQSGTVCRIVELNLLVIPSLFDVRFFALNARVRVSCILIG